MLDNEEKNNCNNNDSILRANIYWPFALGQALLFDITHINSFNAPNNSMRQVIALLFYMQGNKAERNYVTTQGGWNSGGARDRTQACVAHPSSVLRPTLHLQPSSE